MISFKFINTSPHVVLPLHADVTVTFCQTKSAEEKIADT